MWATDDHDYVHVVKADKKPPLTVSVLSLAMHQQERQDKTVKDQVLTEYPQMM